MQLAAVDRAGVRVDATAAAAVLVGPAGVVAGAAVVLTGACVDAFTAAASLARVTGRLTVFPTPHSKHWLATHVPQLRVLPQPLETEPQSPAPQVPANSILVRIADADIGCVRQHTMQVEPQGRKPRRSGMDPARSPGEPRVRPTSHRAPHRRCREKRRAARYRAQSLLPVHRSADCPPLRSFREIRVTRECRADRSSLTRDFVSVSMRGSAPSIPNCREDHHRRRCGPAA